jgi:hypothetical protein
MSADIAVLAATGAALRPGVPTLLIGLTDLAHEQPFRLGAARRPEQTRTGSQEADSPSAARSSARRYGRLTLVPSPELVMTKVPAVATGV